MQKLKLFPIPPTIRPTLHLRASQSKSPSHIRSQYLQQFFREYALPTFFASNMAFQGPKRTKQNKQTPKKQWIRKNLNETECPNAKKKTSLGNAKSINITSFPPTGAETCNEITGVFGNHYSKVCICSFTRSQTLWI